MTTDAIALSRSSLASSNRLDSRRIDIRFSTPDFLSAEMGSSRPPSLPGYRRKVRKSPPTTFRQPVPGQSVVPTPACTSVQLNYFSKSPIIELLASAMAAENRIPIRFRIEVCLRVFPPSTR